ncbi:MAG: CCA tRNA nucleotidyltransferase [Chloroflexota bacterium]
MKTSIRARAIYLQVFTRWAVPADVRSVLARFRQAGFDAFVVGGCVRDLLLGKTPKDWDVTTDATPDEIMRTFPRTVPTGVKHGTVTILTPGRAVEATTYRVETGYSDHRRPDEVKFVRDLREDLARRDFTINAMALSGTGHLVDYFGGLRDLEQGVIRAVGDPAERFEEDALRMLRAIRFAAQLGFAIAPETLAAIAPRAQTLRHVSAERIRDEFAKAITSPHPADAVELLRETGLLAEFLPELLEGYGMEQNRHHRFTVWEHNLIAMGTVPPQLHLRLAALLHDVGKPRSLSVDRKGDRHFFNHEIIGADMAYKLLKRLRFDNATVLRVVHLIRHHMTLHLNRDMKDAAIRRLINRVGLENMDDLIRLREADRAASGKKPGPVSAGTLELLRRIDRILKEDAAFSLKDMAVDGNDIMAATGIKPGPLVGKVLARLFEEVLDDPALNDRDRLLERARQLVAAADAGGAGDAGGGGASEPGPAAEDDDPDGEDAS